MDKERQGEIALAIVKHSLHYLGVKLSLRTSEQRQWTAQAIGVSLEEIEEFSTMLTLELEEQAQLPLPDWKEKRAGQGRAN